MLEGQALKDCKKFMYLGSVMSETGGSEEDIDNRINKARGAYLNLRGVWNSSTYSNRTKIKLFNAIVKSTLVYGCECWAMTGKMEKKLRVFQQKCIRRILRVFYPNLVSNEEILRRSGQRDIVLDIIDRKWRWIGHMARKPAENLTRQAFAWQ